ncbi:hypothetical protein EDC04DRAFT_2603415 [Pisolithus marmoratus]|nr:hypothetical protein EDC04DRAFT_2603415 [Pisolithus marmoratus]
MPNEVASHKRPQSITLLLSTQLTKKKKEGQVTLLVAVSASSSDPSLIDPELDSPVGAIQDEETVDTTQACPLLLMHSITLSSPTYQILPVVPSPHIDPSLIFEPLSTTAMVIMNVKPTIQPASEVSVFQQLLGGLDVVETTNDGCLRFDASTSSIEAIPATAITVANPRPVSVVGSGIGWQEETNTRGGTVSKFSEYWDTLVRNNDSSMDRKLQEASRYGQGNAEESFRVNIPSSGLRTHI